MNWLPKSHNFWGAIFLLLVVLGQSYGYNYLEIFSMEPQSTHMWRKTDCASFALNYYNDGLNPFSPRMHNEFNDQGQSLGEGPILYYLVGVLYKLFGPNQMVYRAFWLLIFVAGLVALQRTTYALLNNIFWSVTIPALVSSVPIIAFYAIGFITNVPALSFVFIAWYFLVKSTQSPNQKEIWWAVLFFLLAGWVKAPALVTYLALIIGGGLYLFVEQKQKLGQTLKHYWPLTIPLFFNTIWYSSTTIYAANSGNSYLSAKLFPFWSMTSTEIAETVEEFKVLWKADFFNEQSFWVYCFLLVFSIGVLAFRRKDVFSWILLFSILGFAGYLLIFFSAFNHHNYYGICVVSLLPITLIYFIRSFGILNPFSFGIAFIAIWLFFDNTAQSAQQQYFRYNDWPNVTHVSRDLFDIEPELEKVGVSKDAKVISIPDYSPNMSLYFLNRRGLTNYNNIHLHPDSVKKYIGKGYQYAVINNPEEKNQGYIKPFLGNQVLKKGNVEIYELQVN